MYFGAIVRAEGNLSIKTDKSLAVPPQIVIESRRAWLDLQLRVLSQYRELLFFLAWRDVKVRYKQTFLGVAWVIMQPVLSTVVFTLLFGMLLSVPSSDVPYPIFSLAALLPWNYFAGSLNKSSTSLVNSASLITKVYFPRLIVPVASVLSGLIDFAITFLVLFVLLLVYQVPLTANILLLPLFLLLAIITALSFGLWLSALNVRYRDVTYLTPFLVQVWMYVTPVIYGSTLIPEKWRYLLALNPLTAVVEGFRWALYGSQLAEAQPPQAIILVSVGFTILVVVSGLIFFLRTEREFADTI